VIRPNEQMMRMNKKCWLIGDPSGRTPPVAAQFAHLRGLDVQYAPGPDALPTAKGGAAPLLAISFAILDRISPRERENIRALVNGGATLYVRGGINQGNRYRLTPLVDSAFTVECATVVSAYRFTRHAMIPAVLRDETVAVGIALNFAADISGPAEPIVVAMHKDGSQSPIVFVYRIGKGAIICDVQQEDDRADGPIVWRLADPIQRCANVGALIAVDCAAERDMSRKPPFNLTIDDIPMGYDYFNESMLADFLGYIESRCASVHLDCAWIPTSQRISRRYVAVLKEHRAGFLWHGLHGHIDHQKLEDPIAEMEAGKRAIDRIARRFGVQLQPVMVFPFERAHRSAEELLLNEGFLAGAEQPRHDEDASESMPAYLRYCAPSCVHESGLRFMHRYESKFLTRDRMIAIASLGMPILAFGHPKDVRLRRLSRFVERGGSYTHFDEVLDFAQAKGLPGRSLEEIAREMFADTSESVPQLQCA
jgi:hypothetical protein